MQPNLPALSICVPSRNRQYYFQETIKALTQSVRDDVEFVFVDNSDDPLIMNGFIEPYLADRRVRYVPSGEVIRPMVDNWEVAAHQTTGRWVTFIGDDDYMDPDAVDVFSRIEKAVPDVDAIDWGKMSYFWPDEERAPAVQGIPLQVKIHQVPKSLLQDRAYRWQSARLVLVTGFTIYHAAVSRKLLERIREKYSGRYFEHPVVDYDSMFKIVTEGEVFIHCSRPLSVLGICPMSNSAAVNNHEKTIRAGADFNKLHKVSMDDMECNRDYPFKTDLGVTAAIGMVHHWFSKTYGHNFSGFEANFAVACAHQCSAAADRQQFDRFVEGYRKAFRQWKNGRYLKDFNPKYKPAAKGDTFRGYMDNTLYVMERTPWTTTVADFYKLVSQIIEPLKNLEIDLESRVDETRSLGQETVGRVASSGRAAG